MAIERSDRHRPAALRIARALGAISLLVVGGVPLFGFMEQGYRLEIVIAIAAEAAAIVSLGAFLACAHGRARDSRRGTPPTGHDDPSARRPRRGRDPAMPQLYMVTVPGLDVRSDWAPIHDRLLDDFPRITDVLATTITATILIVYEGRPEIDAWLDGVVDAIRWRRMRLDGRRHA